MATHGGTRTRGCQILTLSTTSRVAKSRCDVTRQCAWQSHSSRARAAVPPDLRLLIRLQHVICNNKKACGFESLLHKHPSLISSYYLSGYAEREHAKVYAHT